MEPSLLTDNHEESQDDQKQKTYHEEERQHRSPLGWNGRQLADYALVRAFAPAALYLSAWLVGNLVAEFTVKFDDGRVEIPFFAYFNLFEDIDAIFAAVFEWETSHQHLSRFLSATLIPLHAPIESKAAQRSGHQQQPSS
jgi:hypothetical protein